MKLLSRLVPLLAIALALAPGLAAQPRFVQAGSAERDLLVVTGAGDPRVEDGGRVFPLSLPPASRISTINALADGWLVAGTTSDVATSSLLLVARVGERLDRLPLPPGITAPFATRPVPLVEGGALVGLAWLEGDRYDAHAVRAAAWDGSAWSEAETVAPSDLDSQLALSGAVLADGSWLLVWSAVEEADDEIFWSRRGLDGRWAPRHRLNDANDVPDIHPTVVATPAAGALVSWNAFDGSDYRVRTARLEREGWRDTGFLGPAGSVRPGLLEGDAGAYLVYRNVLPDEWVVVEVDPLGRGWRYAEAAFSSAEPPAVTADEAGVTLRFPVATPELEFSTLTVPWRTERLPVEALDDSALTGSQSMAEPGAVVYRAFGDSIMRASGWPVPNPIRFDIRDDFPFPGDPPFPDGLPVCDPDPNTFAVLCGVNWRLEDQLDLVFAADVANDGWGAEATPAGVTRVQTVLDDGGDVLLLMEATNDISAAGTSNVTILANLGTMIDKATASGFDAGIASVIKRRKVDSAGNPLPDDGPNELQTEDLRNSIMNTLAPSKNRVHIDAWSALDPGLGQTDYWNAIGFGDCCGHPDRSGYDKLEPFFTSAILADPVLSAPAPIGPSANTGLSPDFSWSTSGNSRLYQLSMTGPGGTTETWYDALAPPPPPLPLGVNFADCLGDGVCSAIQGPLAVGSYTWKVRGKNLRGLGPFSADLAFEVYDCTGLLADIFLNGSDTGSKTYHACPGSVTSQAGFVVATGESVTLHGTTSVVIEEIVVQNGTTLTLRSD